MTMYVDDTLNYSTNKASAPTNYTTQANTEHNIAKFINNSIMYA